MIRSRLKELRKALNEVTQAKFGEKMGLNANTISGYERTGVVPKSAIVSICQTYNVNREWLETGVGEMFVRKPETQSPEEFAKSFGCDDFTAGIFARYCRFSEEDKTRFSELLRRLVANPDAYLPRQVPERAPTVDASIRVGGNVTGTIEQKIDNRNGD